MRPLLLLVTSGALFYALPYAPRGGAALGTLVPIVFAIAFALAVAGRASGLAVMGGAVAAFTGSLAWSVAPWLGGAAIVVLSYGERALRVRTLRARALHVGLAAAGGAAAGAFSASYAMAAPVVHGVAVVLATVVSLAPLLVAADDPRVARLDAAAARLGLPLAPTLREAAELLRSGTESVLDRETAAHVASSWRALDRLIDARLRLLGSPRSESVTLVTAMLDRQIREHVASLLRAVAAATTMGAAETSLDDSAMRDVHLRGEVLEEQTRAIVEVRAR